MSYAIIFSSEIVFMKWDRSRVSMWKRGGREDLPWTELEVERHPVDRASADLRMSAPKDAPSEWLGPDL